MAISQILKRIVSEETEYMPVADQFSAVSKPKKRRHKPQDRSKLTRNKVVQIRMTEDEVSRLKAASADAGMSMADFVMHGVDQRHVVVVLGVAEIRKEMFRCSYKLSQAIKLGQIAKEAGSAVDMENIVATVGKLNEVFNQFGAFILKWDAIITDEQNKEV